MTVSRLFSRMTILFGPPSTSDDDAFLAELSDMIGKTEPDILNAAGDIIRATHKRRGWPSPAEIMAAIEKASAERPRKTKVDLSDPLWSHDSIGLANRLIVCELGEQAVREGWILTLWDFCRQQRRLPNGYELGRLRHVQDEFDKALASVTPPSSPLQAALQQLGRSMVARGEQLAEIVGGTRQSLTPIRFNFGDEK